MPITRLLQTSVFNPEEVREIVYAFESALAALGLNDRRDPTTDLVAKAIIECAKAGKLERTELRDCALAALRTK
jgi:hypothetical protein